MDEDEGYNLNCPICGSDETYDLIGERQTITICAECGYDGP